MAGVAAYLGSRVLDTFPEEAVAHPELKVYVMYGMSGHQDGEAFSTIVIAGRELDPDVDQRVIDERALALTALANEDLRLRDVEFKNDWLVGTQLPLPD